MPLKTISPWIEFSGLVMAIMDFTGLSIKLESFLDKIRERLNSWLKNRTLPFKTYRQAIIDKRIIFLTFIFCLPFIVYFIYPAVGGVLIFLGLGFSIAAIFLLSVYVLILLGLITYFILWVPYFLLHILNKPRVGIVGTIGLILALTGFAINHLP